MISVMNPIPRIRRGTILAVTLLFLRGFSGQSAEPVWHLQGELKSYNFSPEAQALGIISEIKFELLVQNRRWHLDLSSSIDGFKRHSEMGSDGSFVYAFAAGASGKLLLGGQERRFENAASIYPGPTPQTLGGLDPVWWIFVSDAYFPSTNTVVPEMFGCFGPQLGRFGAPLDGQFLRRGPVDPNEHRIGIRSSKYYPAQAARELTTPVLEVTVLSVTNVDGYTIDQSVRIDRYREPEPGTSNNVVSRQMISITSVSQTNHVQFLPVMTGPTMIDDLRFKEEGRISYLTTNWLSMPQALEIHSLEKKIRQKKLTL